jgi:hypothetical protein
MWRNHFIIGNEHEIKPTSLHGIKAAVVRGNEFKRNLVCGWLELPAEHRAKYRERVVPACNAECCFFGGGVKLTAVKKAVELWKGDFQLAQDGLAFRGQVIAPGATDEEVILKHPSQPLQGAAHRWLAQKQSGCRACDRPFLSQGSEDDEQVKVGLS